MDNQQPHSTNYLEGQNVVVEKMPTKRIINKTVLLKLRTASLHELPFIPYLHPKEEEG